MTTVDDDPDDPRLYIPKVEFYITNVCNLSCTDCNRFNNHNFRGWQNWADYEPKYTQWAQHVRLQRVTILGGEPLLNPSLVEWIRGINRLWGKVVQVLTNGSRLDKVPGLYDALAEFGDPKYPWVKNWVGISLHNSNDRQRCFEKIREFLRGDIEYYGKDHEINVNNAKTYGADHAFVDSNGVRIHVWEYNSFYTAAVQRNHSGRFYLHNSDPKKAHSACGFARYKCYHFIKGRLYKCGPVALFPEFDQQHRFDMTDEERMLMNSYQPLTADDLPTRGKEFLDQIDDVIPQCQFCPETFQQNTLIAVTKKPLSTSIYD